MSQKLIVRSMINVSLHMYIHTTMCQIRESGQIKLHSSCYWKYNICILFTLHFLFSMRVACVHPDIHRLAWEHSLNFEGKCKSRRTYSIGVVCDSSDISIISIHEIIKATNNRFKLKLGLNTELPKLSWNGRHGILNCVTICFKEPFW